MSDHFSGRWVAEHLSTHSEVIAYDHHEAHEGCSGSVIVVKVDGNPDIRQAVAVLLARSPSMLGLLAKGLPIIENEAQLREASMRRHGEDQCVTPYWSEMRDLANEFRAEINRVRSEEEEARHARFLRYRIEETKEYPNLNFEHECWDDQEGS